MKSKKHYVLPVLIVLSALLFNLLGDYWNMRYYHNENTYTLSSPPLVSAMEGIHDKLYLSDFDSLTAGYAVPDTGLSDRNASEGAKILASSITLPAIDDAPAAFSFADLRENPQQFLEYVLTSSDADAPETDGTYSFTTATDWYFRDACFIGDSRTVGISQYSGIENATFLCKTSLTIYDYDKPKITFDGVKTSIQEVLSQKQFAKIYLMVGINECGSGTAESFFESYRAVVEDIRRLQPDALIFIEGNLLVTQSKSDESGGITNNNLIERNNLISTLANQKDIFYVDINESLLCENGALVPEYTWDQVHIKAQYYPIWKDFLLEHAILT